MKRETKKPGRRKPSTSAKRSLTQRIFRRSGGADIEAENVQIGGDVVGRDKLSAGDDLLVVRKGGRLVNIDVPRGVQIAIGVAAAALVVIAIAVLIPRPAAPVVTNGGFESGNLEGWQASAAVQVIATGEPITSTIGQRAAQVPIGASLQQTVTINIQRPQLVVTYRSPNESTRATLNIYVDDELVFTLPGASNWSTASLPLGDEYAGKPVRLRLEYAASATRAGGRLLAPRLQADDVVWIDGVGIVERAGQATATPSLTPTPTATSTSTPPPRATPTGPLVLSVVEAGKACKDSTYYEIIFQITATGGSPPYTYYRDQEQIGGPIRAGMDYMLLYGERSAATGTFLVVDSAGQRVEEKFFSAALDCP